MNCTNIKRGALLKSIIRFGIVDIGDLLLFDKIVPGEELGREMLQCCVLKNGKIFCFYPNEIKVCKNVKEKQ